MYGYIYLTINLYNEKMYVGQHKCKKFDEKYKGSGKLLRRAFKKYGFENFITKTIEWCKNENELNEAEKKWIWFFNATKNSNFYNIALGGEGGNTYSGFSKKELKIIIEKIQKTRKINHPKKIKITTIVGSKEYRDKMSNSLKNSIAHKKAVQSEEFRRKQSENKKKKWKDEEFRKKWISNLRPTEEKHDSYSKAITNCWKNKEYKEVRVNSLKEFYKTEKGIKNKEQKRNKMLKSYLVKDSKGNEQIIKGRDNVLNFLQIKDRRKMYKAIKEEKMLNGYYISYIIS